jgi:hypothetical protein
VGNFAMTNAHVGGIEGKLDVFRIKLGVAARNQAR